MTKDNYFFPSFYAEYNDFADKLWCLYIYICIMSYNVVILNIEIISFILFENASYGTLRFLSKHKNKYNI